MRPLNSGVPKVLILITDGKATDPDETQLQAKKLREMGVRIFAVGIELPASEGSALQRYEQKMELHNLASKPSAGHVFLLKVCVLMTWRPHC